jgi:ferredoxin
MNILIMLLKNLWGGSRDLAVSRAAQGDRGIPGAGAVRSGALHRLRDLQIPLYGAAIEFKAGKGEFVWSYDPGHCTFCGRCVEGCKDARAQPGVGPRPIYLNAWRPEELYTVRANRLLQALRNRGPNCGPPAAHGRRTATNPASGGAQ